MHGRDGGILARSALLFVALAALMTAVSGCGASGGSAASRAKAVPDTAKAVEKAIVAAEGGVIGLKTAEYVARVTFPLETLEKDTTIVATPFATAPGEDDTTLVKGFDVEAKGTGAGPAMSGPAFVEMVVAKELPEGFSLVSYKADGSFDVLPTKVKVGKGVSAVFALAPHFSGVGGRDVGKDKAGKARDQFSDFNWVVYINNKQTGTNGPLTQSIQLKLRAVNSGGDIAGDYKGNATIVSSNKGSIGPGTMTSPQIGTSDQVAITLTEGDPLGSLTREDPLASLVPDPLEGVTLTPGEQMPSWWGTGSITMSAMAVTGSATGYIGGYSGTGGTGNTSTLPVQLQVTGTQVDLRVSGLPPGPMTFKGFIRGEGKK